MNVEILNELETIRMYAFVIMCAIVFWVVMTVLVSAQKLYFGFKKVWNTHFENRMDTYLDKGEYDEIIAECQKKLEKYPNNIHSNWYIAKAYYFLEKNELSKKYFEKTEQLVPSWKESTDEYLQKIEER